MDAIRAIVKSGRLELDTPSKLRCAIAEAKDFRRLAFGFAAAETSCRMAA